MNQWLHTSLRRTAYVCVFLVMSMVLHPAWSIEKDEERFYVATQAFDDGFYDAAISLFQRTTGPSSYVRK